ncbi:MAG: hypothetical protein WCD53_16530 [Microcoleus sp.]
MKKKEPRVKRTMTLTENTDRQIRILAATQRIAVGDLIEAILTDYFQFKAQK